MTISTESITIRHTTLSDLPKLTLLFEVASRGLRERGVDQWQNGYPQLSVIETDIKSGNSYVISSENEVIGTAVISFDGETTYKHIDGEWLTAAESFAVIHRITISPEYRGIRLVDKFFEYARELCFNKGVTSIRIDTHRDNQSMKSTLKRWYFTYCGVIRLESGDARDAYEISL